MKRKAQKKGRKKSRKKGGAGKALFFLVLIGLCLFLAYQFRKEILKSLEPFLKKTPEKRLARRAEKEPEKKPPQRERKIVTLYFSQVSLFSVFVHPNTVCPSPGNGRNRSRLV